MLVQPARLEDKIPDTSGRVVPGRLDLCGREVAAVRAAEAELVERERIAAESRSYRVGLTRVRRHFLGRECARQALRLVVVAHDQRQGRPLVDRGSEFAREAGAILPGTGAKAVELGLECRAEIVEATIAGLAASPEMRAREAIGAQYLAEVEGRSRSSGLTGDAQHAAGLIAVQRRRRSAQHFDALGGRKVDVDEVLRGSAGVVLGNAIDKDPYAAGAVERRGAGAPNRDGHAGRAAQLIAQQRAGHAPQGFFEVGAALHVLDGFLPNHSHGRRDAGQLGFPPGARHDDGLEVPDVARRGLDGRSLRGDRGRCYRRRRHRRCRQRWCRSAAFQLRKLLGNPCPLVVECPQTGPQRLDVRRRRLR